MDSIKSNALYLRLPYIKNNYKEIIKEAEMNELSISEFLTDLLQNEADTRFKNGESSPESCVKCIMLVSGSSQATFLLLQ